MVLWSRSTGSYQKEFGNVLPFSSVGQPSVEVNGDRVFFDGGGVFDLAFAGQKLFGAEDRQIGNFGLAQSVARCPA